MKQKESNANQYLQDHWYLGFLGLIGIYKFPHAISFFLDQGSPWNLLDLLWLLYFCPVPKPNI